MAENRRRILEAAGCLFRTRRYGSGSGGEIARSTAGNDQSGGFRAFELAESVASRSTKLDSGPAPDPGPVRSAEEHK